MAHPCCKIWRCHLDEDAGILLQEESLFTSSPQPQPPPICRTGRCHSTTGPAKAAEWYTKAAEAGDADAMVEVAVCHGDGYGVAKDEAKAFEWYTKAAEKGDINGMHRLGACYEYGEGTAVNRTKAVEWYTKAAQTTGP